MAVLSSPGTGAAIRIVFLVLMLLLLLLPPDTGHAAPLALCCAIGVRRIELGATDHRSRRSMHTITATSGPNTDKNSGAHCATLLVLLDSKPILAQLGPNPVELAPN